MAGRAGGRLIWFTVGVAVGAAAALLCAPVSGEEMRRKIADMSDQGRSALADMIEEGRRVAEQATELFERGRTLVEGVAGDA